MELQDTTQRITYYLDEGDYTHEGTKLSKLGEVEVGSYTNQCYKNDFVQLSSASDKTMKKATDYALGIIISTPQGNIPKESTTFTNLTELRRATITMFSGSKVYNAPLDESADNIDPGDFLVISATSGKLTSTSEENTGCVAEETKLANEGGFINFVVLDNSIKVETTG